MAVPPRPDLGLAVVVPCHDEPDLRPTLAALWRCVRPPCAVEVLVVVNAAAAAAPAVVARNRRTADAAEAWIARHRDPGLAFHVLRFDDLPARHAGVGLARRLGMDESVARLHRAGGGTRVIASLDADCTVAPSYLAAVHGHFARHPAAGAASVYFEHAAADDERLARGVRRYELFLRYHVQGLRFAGSPYAFHTVGSAMAVRADAYQRQGGMNRRQAGEDFHFLVKFMALGEMSEILDTVVHPAARASSRTPFGTGRALTRWLEGDPDALLAYDPRVYRHLGALYARAGDLREWRGRNAPPWVPEPLGRYLAGRGFADRLAEIRANTAGAAAFRKRFLRWFGGLEALKYIHWAAARGLPRQPVAPAARTLLRWRGWVAQETGERGLLARYRALDRAGRGAPGRPGPGAATVPGSSAPARLDSSPPVERPGHLRPRPSADR